MKIDATEVDCKWWNRDNIDKD